MSVLLATIAWVGASAVVLRALDRRWPFFGRQPDQLPEARLLKEPR